MSFFKFLDQVRKRPESQRYGILFVGVAVVMGIVLVLWFTFVYFLPNAEPVAQKDEISPLKVIKDSVLNIYESRGK